MFDFTPNGARMLIRLEAKEAITSGGIHVPDLYQKQTVVGEVIAVGPGECDGRGGRIPLTVEVGELVVLGKWNGFPVTDQLDVDDGHEYYVVHCPHEGHQGHGHMDVYGVLEER